MNAHDAMTKPCTARNAPATPLDGEPTQSPRTKLRVVLDRIRASALVAEAQQLTASYRFERALDRLEEASALDANNEAIMQLANTLHRTLVPRWHFAMLNDRERNQAFERALQSAIGNSRCTVLDIGSGTGLLAMMAARVGAGAVFTCESVKVIARLAQRIIAANQLDDRIAVIPKKSTDMIIGRDMPQVADVLVTETVDCGLLGEGIIPTIRHARNALVRPQAKVIPERARVQFQLLESSVVHNHNFVTEAGGFDVSLFNQLSTKTYFPVRLRMHPHAFLSPVVTAFDFDFAGDTLESRTRKVCIKTTRSGRIHGVAFWFEIDLGGGITLTNAPSNDKSHWMQAIQCFETPIDVEHDQVLTVECRHDDTSIRFSIC